MASFVPPSPTLPPAVPLPLPSSKPHVFSDSNFPQLEPHRKSKSLNPIHSSSSNLHSPVSDLLSIPLKDGFPFLSSSSLPPLLPIPIVCLGKEQSPKDGSDSPKQALVQNGSSLHMVPETQEATPPTKSQISGPIPDSNNPVVNTSVVDSPLPWAARVKASLRNLHKVASPTYRENGIPVVKAPPSVLLKASERWAGYLVAQFLADPPHPSRIYSDLNPIWGKFGNITLRRASARTYFILIPNKSSRDWVVQVGYWQTAGIGFTVSEWIPSGVFKPQKQTSVPIWVKLSNIPMQLYSLAGISVIASAVGEPLHTEKSRLNENMSGEAKVKVVLHVGTPVPEVIEVEDRDGDSVFINASYPRLPSKCDACKEFGHSNTRCHRQSDKSLNSEIKNAALAPIGDPVVVSEKVASPAPISSELPINVTPIQIPQEVPVSSNPVQVDKAATSVAEPIHVETALVLGVIEPCNSITLIENPSLQIIQNSEHSKGITTCAPDNLQVNSCRNTCSTSMILPQVQLDEQAPSVIVTVPVPEVIVQSEAIALIEKPPDPTTQTLHQDNSCRNTPIEYLEQLTPALSSPISVTSANKTISDSATTEEGEIIASAQEILRVSSKPPDILMPSSSQSSAKKKIRIKKLSAIYASC